MNRKPLSELTLMDRFLFDSTMEDRETLELVLSIILDEEIHLVDTAQTEKELRTAPWLRSIRLDIYSADEEGNVYNTEVQKKNTGNLVKRSRFYHALGVKYMQAWEEKYYELQEAREEGLKEGRAVGIQEGEQNGEARFGKLTSFLIKQKRYQELEKASEDAEYRKELYARYSI